MNANNQEVIKYLFRSYSDVSQKAIKDVNDSEFYSNRIGFDNEYFSESLFLDHNMYMYKTLFYNRHRVSNLNSRLEKLNDKILHVYRDLYTRLDDAISSAKGSSLADKSNSDNVFTYLYTPSSMPINTETTTSMIVDGKIIGMKKDSVIQDDKNISNNTLSINNIRCVLTEPNNAYNCIITDSNGIPVKEDTQIINTFKDVVFSGYSDNSGEKEIEIIIDRMEYSKFNNIQILTSRPYIYTLYKSKDNNIYEKLNDKRILTSELNISLENSLDRYIKIVIHLSTHNMSTNRGYLYRYETKGIFVITTKYEFDTIFESADIDINTDGEYIAIDTCDNYQDRNVEISYSVSINDNPWKSIKPVRKTSIYDYGLRSIVPIIDFTEMKIGVLTEYEEDDGNIFSEAIPNTLANSNEFKYFNSTAPFKYDGNYVSTYGILYEDKEFDFGETTVLLNGVPVSGKYKIYSGINKIEFSGSSFKELFNIRNAESISVDARGAYSVKFENPEAINTFIDDNPKENGFSLSMAIFGHKAILGDDITNSISIVNDEDGYRIKTDSKCKRVYVLTRNRLSRIDNIKIRAHMRSKDSYTRPEITRVIFRVA